MSRIQQKDLQECLGSHHQCCKDGHTYWIEKDILTSCPTNRNGSIDTEESGCVESYADQTMEWDEMIAIRNHVLTELIG